MRLLEEVTIAMGKQSVDADVLDMASNFLKYGKAQQMMRSGLARTRLAAMRIIVRAEDDGTKDIYEKVLLGRMPKRRRIFI